MLPVIRLKAACPDSLFRLIALSLPLVLAEPAVSETIYRFDDQDSYLEIHVPRAGLLKALGHDHTILANAFSGRVEIETDGRQVNFLEISVDAARLRVIDAGTSDEVRAKIQKTMLSEAVLYSSAHPHIHFIATGIQVVSAKEWQVSGTLRIREQIHPVSFSATIRYPEPDRLRASGLIELRPSNFGIEPVTALAGSIRTAATIFVRFQISAHAFTTD